jgi:hypothetical protein
MRCEREYGRGREKERKGAQEVGERRQGRGEEMGRGDWRGEDAEGE